MAFQEKQIAEAVLAHCVHVLLADGAVDEAEIRTLEDLAAKLGHSTPLSIPEILDYGFRIGTNEFDEHQKLLCLSECLKVICADEFVHDAESRAWIQLAVSFGYDQGRSRELLKTVTPKSVKDGPDWALVQHLRTHFKAEA